MGLVALTATGIASMVGAGINIIPFMIQRNVPGIGPWVLPAFLFGAVPALFAGLAYAILASAMPRAGGSYVYATRALHPYLGFIASFSQWFAVCVAIGVVSYVLVPFLRDVATAAQWTTAAATLETGTMRLGIPLAVLWFFTAVNILGIKSYERILVPLLGLVFVLGGVVIVAGFMFDQADFARAVLAKEGRAMPQRADTPMTARIFFTAATVLFSGFIGFDAIAQAGGEAKNPNRTLPLAIGLAILCSSVFYILFTAAVYHAVPWQYVAEQSNIRDVNAPGIAGLCPAEWMDGGDRRRRRSRPGEGCAGDDSLGVAIDVRVGRGRDLSEIGGSVACAFPHASCRDPRQCLDGHRLDSRLSSGGRLLSRRRHSRHRDAGELHGHVPVGPDAARPQPGHRT